MVPYVFNEKEVMKSMVYKKLQPPMCFAVQPESDLFIKKY